MTDEQLCEAISSKREARPDNAIAAEKFYFGCDCKNWQPVKHFESMNIYVWEPINWLSWENAGRLLEEMPNGYGLIKQISVCGERIVGWELDNVEGEVVCQSDRPTRAICEAWLEVNQ
jgi:hypothetical protein